MTMKPHTAPNALGFTLIEAVIVIVLLAIAATSVIRLNGSLYLRAGDINNIQKNTLLLQACVDRIIGIRRAAYSGLQDPNFYNSCSTISTQLSINAVSLTQTCPVNSCTQLEIKVVVNSVAVTPPVTLYFSNY
jgi:Tfp pilus assembly protein PilV